MGIDNHPYTREVYVIIGRPQTHIANGPVLYGQTRQPLPEPTLADVLHHGVGVTVVVLTDEPPPGALRRKRHEVVEVRAEFAGHGVQVAEGVHFGRTHLPEGLCRLVLNEGVVQNGGEMKDTSDRTHTLGVGHEFFGADYRRGIGCGDPDDSRCVAFGYGPFNALHEYVLIIVFDA